MRMRIAIGLCLAVLCVGCGSNNANNGGGTGAPDLASACTFGVLAGQSITSTNTNGTTVSGDIGVSPGTAVSRFGRNDEDAGTLQVHVDALDHGGRGAHWLCD